MKWTLAELLQRKLKCLWLPVSPAAFSFHEVKIWNSSLKLLACTAEESVSNEFITKAYPLTSNSHRAHGWSWHAMRWWWRGGGARGVSWLAKPSGAESLQNSCLMTIRISPESFCTLNLPAKGLLRGQSSWQLSLTFKKCICCQAVMVHIL